MKSGKKESTESANVKISTGLHEKVKKICSDTGMKITAFVERSIEKEIAAIKVRGMGA
mgnify:CR=1 FL=1